MFKNLNPAMLGASGSQSEVIELALTYGFRAIAIDIVEFSARAKQHGMSYARRLMDSAKIKVGTFTLPMDLDADEAVYKKEFESLRQYVQLATELECTRCTYTVQPANDKRPYHENFELHRRRFTEICQLFEPAKIQLGVGFRAVETLRQGQAFQFIHDFDSLSLLLNMIGAPNLGLLVDAWSIFVAGGSLDTIRSVQVPQIVSVHLADLPADVAVSELTEQDRFLPGAEGPINSVAILTHLAQGGYAGPVSPMPGRKALDSARRDRAMRQVAEAFDAVWKAAGLTPDGKLAAARK